VPPPPGGPRDWSPPDVDARTLAPARPGRRPIRGAGHIEGIGWARALGWISLGFGLASLVLACFAPMAGAAAWTVGIAFFASFAIWCGFMAEPRYRSSLGRGGVVSKVGIGFGVAAFGVAAYAFVVIALASSGARLPAPAHWLSGSPAMSTFPEPAQTGALPAEGIDEVTDPVEAERLTLGQAVSTAVFVLEQTRSTDGAWPASLAVTTDSSTVISPDGVSLAPLPAGAQVLYSTSSDRREFSLTLLGPLGAIATYESTTRALNTTVP